ncbi:MAG: hypothetical protein AAF499_03255, partial [Pseudomonadota bacterium]
MEMEMEMEMEMGVLATLRDGEIVQLRSKMGTFLHRPDSPRGVTLWDVGIGNLWRVQKCGSSSIRLQSWLGDYLVFNSSVGVTTDTGANESTWTVSEAGGVQCRLGNDRFAADYYLCVQSKSSLKIDNTKKNSLWSLERISDRSPAFDETAAIKEDEFLSFKAILSSIYASYWRYQVILSGNQRGAIEFFLKPVTLSATANSGSIEVGKPESPLKLDIDTYRALPALKR